MATRQQQTGTVAQSIRPRPGRVRTVYEDFRPISEWKQVDDDNILLVYLPSFTKEQIRVSTEAGTTVRIHGEQQVGSNKWSRFEETFRIPQDCIVKGIRAKFEAGILTITMPTIKKTTTTRLASESDQVGPKEVAKPTTTPIPQQAPAPAPTPIPAPTPAPAPRSQDYITTTTTTIDKSPPRQEKKVQEEDVFPITRTDGTTDMNNKKSPLQRGLIPKSTFKFREEKQADDGKGIEKTTTTTEPKSWEDQDGTSPPKGKESISGTVGVEKQPDRGKGVVVGSTSGLIDAKIVEGSEGKGKPTEVIMPEIGKYTTGKEKDSSDRKTAVEKEKDKFEGTTSVGAKDEEAKDYYYSSDVAEKNQATVVSELQDKYKQAMKRLRGQEGHLNDEERQLMVNMGIAVLIIVALGAYISYTLGTRKS